MLSAKAQAHGGHFASPRLARLVRNPNRSFRPSHAFIYSAGGSANECANPGQEFYTHSDACLLQAWVIMGSAVKSDIVQRSTSVTRLIRPVTVRKQV